MFYYRLRRLSQLFTSSTYRRVLATRLCCYLLARLNPRLQYLGLKDGEETTFMFLQDNVVTPFTVAVGNFQKEELERVIDLCVQIGAPLGGVFLDIGANIGTTSLYALRSGRFSHALCVEPAPANQTLLRLNLHVNGFTDRATVRAAAVSDKAGQLQLALSDANCGDHRVILDRQDKGAKTITVAVDTLDHILIDANLRPDDVSFVWIDTQGHEGFVLAGAASLIKQGVPFCIEFWPQQLQACGCYESLLAQMECDFEQFVDLSPESPHTFQPISALRGMARRLEGTIYHTDLLLVPRKPGK